MLGQGRCGMNMAGDLLVMTRVVTKPELVFNQNYTYDHVEAERYFKKAASSQWTLSVRDECYMCQRHRYTLIFYERSCLGKNAYLTEITDDDTIKTLKIQFDKDFLKHRSFAPIIMGTVVRKHSG